MYIEMWTAFICGKITIQSEVLDKNQLCIQ
jgi:hypothetical protein